MLVKEQKDWLKKIQAIDTPTPFLAFDLATASKKVVEFKKYLSDCELYYAVKAFAGDELIKHLDPKVEGFDIASYGEFAKLEKQGVDPSRILFSNPVKIPSHIQKAYEKGVRYFAFDSLGELHKLAKYAPGSNVYLRLKVSDHGSAFPLSSKFGASPEHAVAYMDMAREFGLKPVGLTFHVGSQSESLHTWDVALELCGGIMRRLQAVDIMLDFIDIGGGFPAQYIERVPSLQQVAATINQAVKKHFPYNVVLKAEPGRYIAAEAGLMVTTVIGSEYRGSKRWLFLDVGGFNGMIEPLEMDNWKYPIFVEADAKTSSIPEFYTLTGPTCDSYDTFGLDVPLPAKIGIGDKVFISSAGAYTVVYASDFNGFNIPECVYIKEKNKK